MNKLKNTLQILAVGLLMLAATSMANAQATRTWVSGVGDDVNPCSRTAPCKTFAGAISKTAAGGEISVLDPGGFGTLTATKSITVNGTGTLASTLAAGTNGFIINAAVTDTVILRDISIAGAGTGFDGIRYLSGKTLMVDHCWIYGFNGNGVNGQGIEVALVNNGNLKVIDSVIENISGEGIKMSTTAGQVLATIDRTRIMNCGGEGIEAVDHVRAAVSNSIVTHVPTGMATTGTDSILNVDDAVVSYATTGLSGGGVSSAINVSDSFITQNVTGVSGTVNSFQGNSLAGNSAPGAFSSTTIKQ
jgi:hypothetical protein